jgi:hypothetical protein
MASALLTQVMKLVFKAALIVQILAGALFSSSVHAITVDELRTAPNLTPEQFASHFSTFAFKFHDEVQSPETFLATRSGDCDDYATLAADVLGRHGYTTRLIAVRMKGETHVVCYVVETGSYLDYNARNDEKRTIACSPKITEIAKKVAQSFQRGWVATYEFTYGEKVKRLVDKILTNRSV